MKWLLVSLQVSQVCLASVARVASVACILCSTSSIAVLITSILLPTSTTRYKCA